MNENILSEILFKIGDIQNQQGNNTASIEAILEQTKKTNGRVTKLEDYKVEITKILAENQKILSNYSGIMKNNEINLQRLLDKEIIYSDREKNELKKQNIELKTELETENLDIKKINQESKNKIIQWALIFVAFMLIASVYKINVLELIKIITQ